MKDTKTAVTDEITEISSLIENPGLTDTQHIVTCVYITEQSNPAEPLMTSHTPNNKEDKDDKKSSATDADAADTKTENKSEELHTDDIKDNDITPSVDNCKITESIDAQEIDRIPNPNELTIAEDAVSRVSSLQGDMCRICHCIAEDSETLISPCDCCGSMKWVHQKCLQRWVKSRDAKKCELCGFSFNMTSSVKPFRKWKKLNMSSVERRRVLCSVTFHVVAITCVIWSLYVLIDRTTQEITEGNLNWPFWTKLVVVAIGFTGGLVFMYVQCKTYVKLFRRWKQFNRVIYINDIQLPDSDESEATISIEMPASHQQEVIAVRVPDAADQIPV